MKNKKPLRFTVLFIPSDSGDVKQYKISADFIAVFILIIVLIIGSLIAYFIYSSNQLNEARDEIEALNGRVEIVTSSNIILQADNEALERSLAQAEARLSTKEYVQQQSDSAEALNYIPSGLPLDGQVSTPSAFSETNQYITFRVGDGARITASGAGKVSDVRDDVNFGYIVTIDHGNDYNSIYYYNSKPLVSKGDGVIRGTALFMTESEEPVFAYQITYQGKFIDPNSILKIDG